MRKMSSISNLSLKKSLESIRFNNLFKRSVVADFNGGNISSDAGGLLLREISESRGIISGIANCFTDYRNPEKTEHTVSELVAQRIFGLALGYEDLNDHDDLRKDPLLATLAGKQDPTGSNRKREEDFGNPLASRSTLNRLELTPPDADEKSRYKKVVYNSNKMDDFFVNHFLNSYKQPPAWIVLDVDATDDPTHGKQEGSFFHGYYDHYCFLPLYIFCDDHILCARLRTSNIDASKGTVDEMSRIIGQIRQSWPEVKIIVRGDSGFCRDDLMTWCESQNDVYYLLGLSKNNRLKKILGKKMRKAKIKHLRTKEPARFFKSFTYRPLKRNKKEPWSKRRRVIGKAEHLSKGENPRFIVTNLPKDYANSRELYEDHYCARGDMENRIKEQQLWLFADRTSTALMRSNQLRLYFSSFAYLLISELRRVGLKGTKLAKAQVVTIRSKLFKIGAQINVTTRRVHISLSSGYPYADLYRKILDNLRIETPLLN